MSSNDVVISVKNLSKRFEIYDRPVDRLKQFLLPKIQRLLGKTPKQYFGEFWALDDVSFEVKRGETIGIIGRNGSGKSTLLQMICGTLTPTAGNIQTNGRIAALLELGSGFNPEFTGRENVYLNASVLGLSNEEINQRYNQIVTFADIGDFIDQPVKTYSSGMMVRLAFAVIAHVDADILVIDEALAVGDAFFTQKCMRFLRDFMKEGTVVFVSHDTAAINNLCESAIWLVRGRVKLEGQPKDVAQEYLAELNNTVNSQYDLSLNADFNTSKGKVLKASGQIRDMRLDYINQSKYRNDIEIFKFDLDAKSFGSSAGKIVNVQLLDQLNNPLSWVVGGERVCLAVTCFANLDIKSPIIGFFVNDRLGQTLFGDNTLSFNSFPVSISRGREFKAEFEFYMPILPIGDYTVTVALAEGTQFDHVQHHWVHEALSIKSHSASVTSGLVGIPMTNIKLYEHNE